MRAREFVTAVHELKKNIIQSQFDYSNIPTIEEYNNNSNVREDLKQRIFRHCWNTGYNDYNNIIYTIESKIWKRCINESDSSNLNTVITTDEVEEFIKSLWTPIPNSSIKPGMVVDALEVENPAVNILKISVKPSKTVARVQQFQQLGAGENWDIGVLFTDGDMTLSNLQTFQTRIGAYFLVDEGAGERGLSWIVLKTDRVNGYRPYDKFLIDLPGESPFDRYRNTR